jgi:hypothetical protein
VLTEHPPNDVLVDYSKGKLDAAGSQRVERHVANCIVCGNDVKNLIAAEEALENSRAHAPDPGYFHSILPRVRARIEGSGRVPRYFSDVGLRVALPLGASIICILILINLPSISFEKSSQTEALLQITKAWTYDEIVDAVADQPMSLSPFANRASDETIEGRQLFGDRFERSALFEQITAGEINETNMEDVLSSLNREQIEWLLASYQERDNI